MQKPHHFAASPDRDDGVDFRALPGSLRLSRPPVAGPGETTSKP